ncbi:hypothetical protein SODG_005639 [Sodalis praecaptivus]|nr:hypothetical protein NVIRENTERO_04092 [Sodalis praecaptivus]
MLSGKSPTRSIPHLGHAAGGRQHGPGQFCEADVPARSGAKRCCSTSSGAHWPYPTMLPSACCMYNIRPVVMCLMSRITDVPSSRSQVLGAEA